MKKLFCNRSNNDANNINQKYLPEYLITNGIGGYASSTILNLNTRKYHGLLVAKHNNDDRYVMLSGIDERIEINGKIYELGSHHYKEDCDANKRDIFYPEGFKFFKGWTYNVFPKFYYLAEDVEIEKEILMPHYVNAVIVHYKVKNARNKDIKLSLSPLLNMRNFHKNGHILDKGEFTCEVSEDKKGVTVLHDKIKICLISDMEFLKNEYVLWNAFYREEKERRYDCFEDLYCPGYFVGDKGEVTIITSLRSEISKNKFLEIESANETNIGINGIYYEKYKQEEILRIKNLINFTSFHSEISKTGFEIISLTPGDFQTSLKITDKRDEIFKNLSISADKFIIKHHLTSFGDLENFRFLNSDGYGIIAGYHWFGEWGRDTMLSIPGLCLTTGRFDVAKGLIKRWLNFLNDGLIPNFIPEKYPFECPHNSCDASLWLFNAAYYYYLHTNDVQFIEEIHQKLCEIVEGYIKGNSACKMDDDCLIISNPQTTWMDTKWTKREGKAVEINALWFNALSILKFFSNKQDRNFNYEEILKNVKKNFEIFWNEERGCLYDVILNNKPDDSVRPNQIFAMGLPFNVIDDERGRKIFNVIFEELYTPYGLRTLSRKDKNYIGVYGGNEENRDKAYHNGTVWPFLTGNFIDAYLKINNYSPESKKQARNFLSPLLEYAHKFRTIPEIFDGDFPHKPRGCIAQAWSVAEILRAWNLLKK
ncbi:MAG: hypothetical protein BWK75_05255 [Candidatus Altiarchaeales archaeon A3]|nr:MAG: hypothetical protein BWK75_05255 [Candidatus Altiarchaeales archaeon A3]